MAQKKTIEELLQEEKEKLLAEVNETIERKKAFMISEPETEFQNLLKRK